MQLLPSGVGGILVLDLNVSLNRQFRLESNLKKNKIQFSLTFSKQWDMSATSLHSQPNDREEMAAALQG